MNHLRKVIRIRAEDSPNVKLALAQIAMGKQPDGRILVPGVLTWERYQQHRKTWDAARQCVGLDADWYTGPELFMFPAEWLTRSAEKARDMSSATRRAKGMGIDPAEGGDRTVIAVVDEHGVMELLSLSTPDTSVIRGRVLDALTRHQLSPDKALFDAGGGGKQIADAMRQDGYGVRVIAFGSSPQMELRRGMIFFSERQEVREDKGAYAHMRDQLYGELRLLLDPSFNERGFGIGAEHQELHRQLSLIPLTHDREGKLSLLPKNNPRNDADPRTLVKLIGHSPDEADALALACHAMLHQPRRSVAGAA